MKRIAGFAGFDQHIINNLTQPGNDCRSFPCWCIWEWAAIECECRKSTALYKHTNIVHWYESVFALIKRNTKDGYRCKESKMMWVWMCLINKGTFIVWKISLIIRRSNVPILINLMLNRFYWHQLCCAPRVREAWLEWRDLSVVRDPGENLDLLGHLEKEGHLVKR